MEKQQTVTDEYIQKAFVAFKHWYRQNSPTLRDASIHAEIIARDTVGGLDRTQVISLLQEHPDWIYAGVRDRGCLPTIGELTRQQLVAYIEQAIQQRALEVLLGNTIRLVDSQED